MILRRWCAPRFSMFSVAAAGLLAPTAFLADTGPARADAEPVSETSAALYNAWETICSPVPIGSFPVAESPDREGVVPLSAARTTSAWGETDFFDIKFRTDKGDLPGFDEAALRDGGFIDIRLTKPDHPDITQPQDGWACVKQGSFSEFRPRSITPVTLDDERPGRVIVYDYTARWSEPMLQRYGDLTPDRSVAALVSYNPGQGWGDLEADVTIERGKAFAPDMFASKGLWKIDLSQPHPDRIEFVDDPARAWHLDPLYRFPEYLPAEVVLCAVKPAREVGNCLKAEADKGAILGHMTLCEREDIACMRDLLFAEPFTTLPAQCVQPEPGSPGDIYRCAAFAASHGLDSDTRVELVSRSRRTLVRTRDKSGAVAIHIPGSSTLYADDEPQNRDDTNRPWLTLSCAHDALSAALSYPAMPPQWQGGETISLTVPVPFSSEEPGSYTAEADETGRILTVAATDTAAFVRDVFAYRADGAGKTNGVESSYSYYSFDIMQAGKEPFTSGFHLNNPDDVVQLWEGMTPACSEQLRSLIGGTD